jgi:hypothetical protein
MLLSSFCGILFLESSQVRRPFLSDCRPLCRPDSQFKRTIPAHDEEEHIIIQLRPRIFLVANEVAYLRLPNAIKLGRKFKNPISPLECADLDYKWGRLPTAHRRPLFRLQTMLSYH